MKILSLIPLLIFGLSQIAHAQEAQQPKRRSRLSYGVSTFVWQEKVDAKLNGSATKMRGQALSIGAEIGYERFIGRRAQYFWEAKAGFMTGSMYASDSGTARFKTSSFIGGYFEPGLFRRQTAKAEFGMIFPINYRIVNWESFTPGLSADDGNQLTYGIGGRANFVFNDNNYLSMGLVYRLNQPSALWIISYDWR